MPNPMTIRNFLKVQLNEKVSETQYDVLHPETKADYVLTNDNLQFISRAEKELLASLSTEASEKGLFYYGTHLIGTEYPKNAIVEYGGSYYLSIVANNRTAPTEFENTDNWLCLNLEAYDAQRAESVKIDVNSADTDRYLTFAATNSDGYQALGIASAKYNPYTNTLSVGKVEAAEFVGLAAEAGIADKYYEYEYNSSGVRGDRKKEDGVDVTSYISDAIYRLGKAIDTITGGGATLQHPLKITKDGDAANVITFDGTQELTIDIKQTYDTSDITDLTENGKIKTSWLPDSIVGQLYYQGVFNATDAVATAPKKGDYYVANAAGNKNPDGTEAASSYAVGDWAVYNGTSWDKVDNTDAVVMVNGQIGHVQTYKGDWTARTNYHRGDIIRHSGRLYLCTSDVTTGDEFATTSLALFGKSYVGSAGITVNNETDTIGHNTTVTAGSNTTSTLDAASTIVIPDVTVDSYGHVSKIDTKTYSISADLVDSTRPIKVKGLEVLAGTGEARKTAVDFVGDNTWTDTEYKTEGNQVVVKHKEITATETDLSTDVVDKTVYAGQTFKIPAFTVDKAGHVKAGSLKTITLADQMFVHKHFDITTNADGSKQIGAFGADIANAEWVNSQRNILKFYTGNVNPVATDIMVLNGGLKASALYQGANKVIDTSATISQGQNHSGNAEILGTFDTVNNKFVMADTGVTTGVYSAVSVNSKGLVVGGGQIIEFGETENADPSESLAVGGLFFRKLPQN